MSTDEYCHVFAKFLLKHRNSNVTTSTKIEAGVLKVTQQSQVSGPLKLNESEVVEVFTGPKTKGKYDPNPDYGHAVGGFGFGRRGRGPKRKKVIHWNIISMTVTPPVTWNQFGDGQVTLEWKLSPSADFNELDLDSDWNF